MFINYWDGNDWSTNETIKKIKDTNEDFIMTGMFNDLGDEAVNLSTIEIETVNRCNNDCSFCPANKNKDIRHITYMDEKLFKKIIDELSDMDYRGKISLFSNNEALLDKRIFDFIEYAKGKLPNAFHILFTNGILLDNDKFIRLTSMLDHLIIDNYNDELKLNNNIEEIYNINIGKSINCPVTVHVRKKNQVLLNRGSLASNNISEFKQKMNSPCVLPFIQMIIRPDGKISRCCQDVYGNETLGDLNVQTISEVWNGQKYESCRKSMLEHKRCNLKYCRDCDLAGMINYFPNQWYEYYHNNAINVIKKAYYNNKKIVLYKINHMEMIVNELRNCGCPVEYIVFNEEIDKYITDDSFIVMDNHNDKILEKLICHGKKCIEDYIIFTKAPDNNSSYFRNNKNIKIKMEKIFKASDEGKLIIYGAGKTGNELMGYYNLKPKYFIDNNKFGDKILNYNIFNYEVLKSENKDCLILVAMANYVDVIKALQEDGFSAENIVIGIDFI